MMTLNLDVMTLLAQCRHRFRLSYIRSCKWEIHKCKKPSQKFATELE